MTHLLQQIKSAGCGCLWRRAVSAGVARNHSQNALPADEGGARHPAGLQVL